MYVCYVCTCVYIYMYVRACIYIYMYIYVNMYIYIYHEHTTSALARTIQYNTNTVLLQNSLHIVRPVRSYHQMKLLKKVKKNRTNI